VLLSLVLLLAINYRGLWGFFGYYKKNPSKMYGFYNKSFKFVIQNRQKAHSLEI